MEELANQQKLPNATTSTVLGIVSFIACCFSSGLGGVLLSGIALYLANKDLKLHQENPDMYYNFKQAKTAKTIAIIGLVLGILTLISVIIFILSMGGMEGYRQFVEEQMEVYKDL